MTYTKESYQATLLSVFNGTAASTEQDLSAIMAPEFTVTDDETTRDFPAFIARVKGLREMGAKMDLQTVQFISDGRQIAERHLGTLTMGEKVMKSETWMFVELAADGRMIRVHETTKARSD